MNTTNTYNKLAMQAKNETFEILEASGISEKDALVASAEPITSDELNAFVETIQEEVAHSNDPGDWVEVVS